MDAIDTIDTVDAVDAVDTVDDLYSTAIGFVHSPWQPLTSKGGTSPLNAQNLLQRSIARINSITRPKGRSILLARTGQKEYQQYR